MSQKLAPHGQYYNYKCSYQPESYNYGDDFIYAEKHEPQSLVQYIYEERVSRAEPSSSEYTYIAKE